MEKSTLQRAQANMMVAAGIAIGISETISGQIDKSKSFFHNAMEILASHDDDFLRSMIKELQEHINDEYERRTVSKIGSGTEGSDQASVSDSVGPVTEPLVQP